MTARVSIRQVAELAGVSIATVSRCINTPGQLSSETRARVEQAIRQTGFVPDSRARNFRRGHTNIIMVVLPGVGDPFFTEVMLGIHAASRPQGYSVIITETQGNTLTVDEVGAMLVSREVDGVILLASVFPFGERLLPRLKAHRQPLVVACEAVSHALAELPGVHIDNLAAAREATEYLLSLGHRRIAFIGGAAGSLLTADREAGFLAAMREAGLDGQSARVESGGLSLSGAAGATRRLLQADPRPTAIFCATDEMALGCMHQAHQLGLAIPGDLSVMGFDDTRLAAIAHPPLTTVSQPARRIGERVAERLLGAIAQGVAEFKGVEILPHQLVVRESAGPAPG